MQNIKYYYDKCTKCRKCYDLCPEDIIVIDKETGFPKVAPGREGECWFCGICWMSCPKRAIEICLPASLW